jgi:hypothetical protein
MPIIEILKTTNDKNIKNVTIENFFKFLEGLCIYLYNK